MEKSPQSGEGHGLVTVVNLPQFDTQHTHTIPTLCHCQLCNHIVSQALVRLIHIHEMKRNYTSTKHSALLTPQPSAYKHYTPSTTNPTAFHDPPMHTTNKHNAYSWQMEQDVADAWCESVVVSFLGWLLRISSLRMLVFIQKSFL